MGEMLRATRNEWVKCCAPTWFKKSSKSGGTERVAFALLESNPTAASFPHS